MAGEGTQLAQRRSLRSETVRHDGLGYKALVLELFHQKFQRLPLFPSLLDEDIEDLSFLVDGPPHEHSLAADLNDHLIQVPDAIGPILDIWRDGCFAPHLSPSSHPGL